MVDRLFVVTMALWKACLFHLKKSHVCKENAFVGGTAELRLWVALTVGLVIIGGNFNTKRD